MEEDKILLNLQPGDRFKVNFREKNREYINSRFLVYAGCWLRVREILDHPEYYEGCVYGADYYPEDNDGAIIHTNGNMKTMRWQQGQDFLDVQRRELVAQVLKQGRLPNI